MQTKYKYILIAIGSFIILGYLFFSLRIASGFGRDNVCKKVEIKVNNKNLIQLISEKDVSDLLEQEELNPIGKSIKRINTEFIEDELLKNPMIKSVECYKTPSGVVKIVVSQRTPKFRIVGFQSYYIDENRERMPVSLNYGAYVPVVSGRVTYTLARNELFDFITFLEENPFWNYQIEQINVRDDQKIELVPRVGDAIIVLGTFDNYQAKLEKLRKLYSRGFNLVGWNKYKVIDIQYKDQVVCSKSVFQPRKIDADTSSVNDSIIVKKI